MKIAIYHNLPSGGAKRSLYEQVRRTNQQHHYDLYRLDLNENESFMDLRPLVESVYSYPFDLPALPRILRSTLRIMKLKAVHRRIAHDIDRRDYDLVFTHPCRFTQGPALLSYLKTPSVYYMHEPRRSTFEYRLFPFDPMLVHGPVQWFKYHAMDLLTRPNKRLDLRAVKAASKILCNSYYSLESIANA